MNADMRDSCWRPGPLPDYSTPHNRSCWEEIADLRPGTRFAVIAGVLASLPTDCPRSRRPLKVNSWCWGLVSVGEMGAPPDRRVRVAGGWRAQAATATAPTNGLRLWAYPRLCIPGCCTFSGGQDGVYPPPGSHGRSPACLLCRWRLLARRWCWPLRRAWRPPQQVSLRPAAYNEPS